MNRTTARSRPLSAARYARRRGVAMVLVMIALVVGTIVTLSFLSSQTTSTAVAHNARRQVQARAIAEDAVELAMEFIRADEAWRDGFMHGTWSASQALSGGDFRVMFEDDDDADLGDDVSEPFTLTAEGTYDGLVHRVSMLVTPMAATPPLTLLLVTGSATISDEDLAKKTLFESWGYEVVTVVDTDGQSEYDAAAATADVAYVSKEVVGSDVGTKLNDTPLGVVCEETNIQDELGMNSGNSAYTGSTIDIVDNTHPIVSGFPLGELQIAASNTDLIRAAGTAAAGLTTLAERVGTDHRVLTLLDVGDTDLDDNPSPQRRVVLPWGGGSFEIGDLNTDGLTLLRQALEWAAAGEPYTVTTPAPIARWSFEETSGTTAADSVGDHDGFYRSGVVLGAEGRSGYAAEFDGASHYVEIPHDDEFLLDQGALSVWFYLDDVSGRKELVSKDSSGYDTGGQFTMYVNNAALYIRFSSTTSHYSMSHGTLSPQTWHHVAFTFGPGGMRFYLDGALVDSDPYTGGWGSTSGGAGNFEPMAFGANTWSSGNGVVTPLKNYLDGRLDEVGIYDQQLSDAEVLALFQQAPVAAEAEASEVPQLQVLYEFIEPTPTVPTPVAHWRLDETQANTLYTETGGTVVIEAERYTRRVAGANGGANMTWYLATGDDASDGLMLKAGPDGGSGVSVLTDGPRVDYDIVFNTPGTYRLWARLRADDSGDDEVHVGFEGVALSDSPGAGLTVPTFDTWHWIDDVDGGPSDLTVSVPTPGTYTLNFWMIENGMTIDKIVLSTDPTAPTGLGPTANGRTGEVENQHSSQTGSFRDGATPGAGGMGDGGTSVQLDGVDDYVEFPHEDAHLIDEGTVSFWFYADRVAGTQTLISKDADNNRAGHMRIYLNQFGGLGARLQNESSSSYSISVPNGSISTGRWYHVALAFGTDGMSLYLDGVRNDTDAYTGGLGASGGDPLGNREHWTFGIDHWDSRATELNSLVFPFMGRIDDVRLYDQNLSETQIAAIVALSDPGAEASATVQDTAGVAPPLDLTIADPDHVTWVSGGGLTIDTETLITSGAAPRLHDAITETDQITVEAEYTPAALDRNEITRVFCYEDLHHLRNFSVTHRLERHRAILRTDFTMSGGESEQSAPLLAVGERAHVIMTYDGSELTVYVNGTAVINTPLTGDLDTWDDSYILSMANAVPGGRPFFGTLHRMAIWDKAVNAVQAENLFNGNPPGEPDGGEDGLDYEVEWLESP